MKTQDISVFMQGYFDAAMHGVSRDENPYREGTKQHTDWNEGFDRHRSEEQSADNAIALMGGEPTGD